MCWLEVFLESGEKWPGSHLPALPSHSSRWVLVLGESNWEPPTSARTSGTEVMGHRVKPSILQINLGRRTLWKVGEETGGEVRSGWGPELRCWKPGQQILPAETDTFKAELCRLYIEPGFY